MRKKTSCKVAIVRISSKAAKESSARTGSFSYGAATDNKRQVSNKKGYQTCTPRWLSVAMKMLKVAILSSLFSAREEIKIGEGKRTQSILKQLISFNKESCAMNYMHYKRNRTLECRQMNQNSMKKVDVFASLQQDEGPFGPIGFDSCSYPPYTKYRQLGNQLDFQPNIFSCLFVTTRE